MKTLIAIFIFAILSANSAFATKVAPRSCKPPGCTADDPQLKAGDGAVLISCAATNGYKKSIAVSFDPNCGDCLATACEKAKLEDDEIKFVEGKPADGKPVAPGSNAEKQGGG